ncbi:subtilisin-like protease [Purpureocillium lilacinum]|uniref:Subtilisin-like protease n=1 Tax=Purpureocillium lilacinum TaxID=33203 RepID=A0A179FEW1_PURLI|nr:subtilisin-like protease [Purpureocillium lilacinum]OAQ63830.1 subtilisin-like protease [Purpureocillium lilacinum]
MRVATLLALFPLTFASPTKRSSPAPVLIPQNAKVIDGKYIVKMRSGENNAVSAAVESIAAHADYIYSHSFDGFAASLTKEEVEKLQNSPHVGVEFLEKDAVVTISATQQNADWGLARLSSPNPGSTDYTYDDSAGEGTCAYIIDTGVDVQHPVCWPRQVPRQFIDQDKTGGNGHGTHVSGTIGSKTYGVAKKTFILGVKALDASGWGTNSGVIAGMEFVAKDGPCQSCPKGVVVNMSLGGGKSDAVNQAAANIVKAGLFLAVAAGNDGADASGYSPASEPTACTVGATVSDDSLATYSNIGSLIKVLAPGTDIISTWPGASTNKISGTSMASPHVAGIGAYFLGLGQKAEGLCDYIAQTALKGVISGVSGDTANLLINNGQGGNGSFRAF